VRAGLDELRDLFVRLAEIASPSGEEREIADAVKSFVADVGLKAEEDGSAAATGATSGNLVVRVAGRGRGMPIALCAHLDTVPVVRPPVAVVADGEVRSDGETILGADDKAAVAVLLMVLRDLAREAPPGGVEVVFTVAEEVALAGAKEFDISSLGAEAAFVLDSDGAPGTIITGAPGVRVLEAEFRGAAAHAGIEPEAGRSAVVAAARAVAEMRLGRLDDETTANVGLIAGGTAVNVVPERCSIRGEARSHAAEKLSAQVAHMVDAVATAAAASGVDVEVTVDDAYEGYAHAAGAAALSLAQTAVAEAGLVARPVAGGGGSDANILNAEGLPAVTLGVGFEQAHSPQEAMKLERLAQLYDLVHALVDCAGRVVE
jgi:tripeptide aminopeptidase